MSDTASENIKSQSVRNYALGILVIVYTFNFIDRNILSILLQSIKTDLNLSDTSLGLLSGFAFAAFYATLGIPIAKYADRGNRRNLISISLADMEFNDCNFWLGPKLLTFTSC